MKPIISVIVPVYMVERYLDTCINSLINQTFKYYEVILIDDGSYDNSSEICDKYALNYEFIKVIHKENGGPSEARNYGVKKSKGKYITFVDSDDFISKDYLERLYTLQKKYNADISIVGLKKVTSLRNCYNNKFHKVVLLSGFEALLSMLYQKGLDTTPCAMLIQREVAEKYPFPKGKFHEDDYTTYKYFLEAHTIVFDSKARYFYLQRDSSIMHSEKKAYLDEISASQSLVDIFQEQDRRLFKAAESKMFSNFCQILMCNHNLKLIDKNNYEMITKWLKSKRVQILFDSNTRIKNKMAAIILFLGDRGLSFFSKFR